MSGCDCPSRGESPHSIDCATSAPTVPDNAGLREAWRVGNHYGIHVYEGDRPVATFHREADARRCVEALAERDDLAAKVAAVETLLRDADRYAPRSVLNRVSADNIRRALQAKP